MSPVTIFRFLPGRCTNVRQHADFHHASGGGAGAIPLRLAPGAEATLELPIPDALAGRYQIGDTIPAWWLDLDSGAWREEGVGTVQASTITPGKLAWRADVEHFTWWNADVPLSERSCFQVQVIDSNGAPVPDLAVSAVGQSFTGTTAPIYTGGSGQACVEIPLGGTALIYAGPIEAPLAAPVSVTGALASDCTGQVGTCAPLTITIPAGSVVCTPGASVKCPYTGAPGTQGVGVCQAGTNYCLITGTAWTGCDGEVKETDNIETCSTAFDDDCDGDATDGLDCTCTPPSTILCYPGPASTEGVGMCHAGQQECLLGGLIYGSCNDYVVPEPEKCSTPGDDDCDGSTDCSGSLIWSFSAGSPANQGASGVAVDAAGNVLFNGFTTSAFDIGGGPLLHGGGFDSFLTKRDAGGQHLWSKGYGSGNGQFIWRVATDGAQNIYVCGWFYQTIDFGGEPLVNGGESNAFIAKLDPQGNRLWSKQFGDGDLQLCLGLAVDGAGNAIIAGPFRSGINLGGGPLASAGGYDAFVAKFDPAGNHLWSVRYGQASDDGAEDVAVDAMGNVIVTGYAGGSVHYNSGPTTAYGAEDVLVLKLDPGGNELWSARFGDAGSQIAQHVEVDSAGSIVVSGGFSSALDFGGGPLVSAGASAFLAKLDSAGNHLWSKALAGVGQFLPIAIDSADRITATGAFIGTTSFGGAALTSAGGADLFFAKLDPAGGHLWSKRFGDAAGQAGRAIAIDGAGDLVVAGRFDGTVDFPGGPITSVGGGDVFLAKLAQ